MGSLNKVLLVGNLGQDPELKYTNNQVALCTFSVATSETYTGKDGQKKENVEWHKIVIWGKHAENCARYLEKGKQVLVEGKLKTKVWEDYTGAKRSSTEIVASNVQFLSSSRKASPTMRDPVEYTIPDDYSDIPF